MKKSPASQPPTVAMALMVGTMLVAGFTGLAAVVLPGFPLMLMTGAALLLFFAAQYFLWARWLFPIVQRWESESVPQPDVSTDAASVNVPQIPQG